VIIYGINPVVEALRSGRVVSLRVTGDRLNPRVLEILRSAERDGVPVKRVPAADLERAARGGVHQGIVAELREQERIDLTDLVQPWIDRRDTPEAGQAPPLLVVLDGIEDPHNVGAILRSVDAAGADGVVRQSRRAAALEGAAAKASAGAVSHVKIAEVVNIARALEELKELGVWTVGLVGGAPKLLTDIDLTLPTAIVLGAEGEGLRRLVRERCDWLASIPMRGHVQSLNVSVAAGIALFEAVRQRSPATPDANR
jgi:23S rRNA (guanosine2251-2'-O)-methyltransferase